MDISTSILKSKTEEYEVALLLNYIAFSITRISFLQEAYEVRDYVLGSQHGFSRSARGGVAGGRGLSGRPAQAARAESEAARAPRVGLTHSSLWTKRYPPFSRLATFQGLAGP